MHNREESAFTLFDALCQALLQPYERLENALGVLQKIRGGATKDGALQKILPGLAWCFRRISGWREFCAENPNPSWVDFKAAGFALKNVQDQYRNATQLWNKEQTADCLSLLASVEADTRFMPTEAHDSLLETMLYELIFKKGSPLEQAVFAL